MEQMKTNNEECVEEWRDIIGYEGLYQVSNLGRIRSVRRRLCNGKIRNGSNVAAFPDAFGYWRVKLHVGGIGKRFMVHRLVARAFVENPNNLPYVNHKDEDKSNNAACNLEWCDQRYNINYGTRTEKASGENTKNSKLTNKDIIFIREHYVCRDKEYGSRQLAKMFGVSISAINRVVCGVTWKHIK